MWTWIHSDHLHSATVMTNSAGQEVRRLAYTAFGEEAVNSGSGDKPPYTYTGKELDSTGLMYYGARYYDPVLCRFITPDTVYDVGPQGLNRYSYALNNPIIYRDPTGNFAFSDVLDFLEGWMTYNASQSYAPTVSSPVFDATNTAVATVGQAADETVAALRAAQTAADYAADTYSQYAAESENLVAKAAWTGTSVVTRNGITIVGVLAGGQASAPLKAINGVVQGIDYMTDVAEAIENPQNLVIKKMTGIAIGTAIGGILQGTPKVIGRFKGCGRNWRACH